jgi:asparagine synthase (glutamine-hydrolysing)
MGFVGLVSFSHSLQRRDRRLLSMTATLDALASSADAHYFWRAAAFAHWGIASGYAEWRHPLRPDPDCLVVVDAALADRNRLEQKLYGSPRPLAVTAEVVLDAYRNWGANLVDHLQGAFSVAIWDAVLQRLLLTRDPLGVKTAFLVHDPAGSAFATEANVLLPYLAVAVLDESTGRQLSRTGAGGSSRHAQELLPGETVQVTAAAISRERYQP